MSTKAERPTPSVYYGGCKAAEWVNSFFAMKLDAESIQTLQDSLAVFFPAPPPDLTREAVAPKSVYISGPMTGYDLFNYPAFAERAAAWRAAGWTVRNPAEHFGGSMTESTADYMREDIHDLLNVEAIALLPNWEQSKGANLELSIAQVLGLTVLDAMTFSEISAPPAAALPPEDFKAKFERVVEAVRQMGGISAWHPDGVLCVPKDFADAVFNAAYDYTPPVAEILNAAHRQVAPILEREARDIRPTAEVLGLRLDGAALPPVEQEPSR